ncbi:ABC transporter permease [Paraflavisolibacter sp. H34]|uniref:MlaE family ABC transporter permease n=1 Tax=Huijunlia imazamoxiresistens TaxID=3127457 RepID=UPI00301A8083
MAKYVITKKADRFLAGIYDAGAFTLQFFREVFTPPFEPREIIRQCYEIGYKSLPLTTLTGFVTGIVFTKQSRPSLIEFGATAWLPALVGVAMVKALAPLVTSLICAGKIGSRIGAELGSMKVSEQIDAMEVSAVNPYKFLVVSRVLATTLMIPALTMYFGLVGFLGSFVDVHRNELTSLTTFFIKAFEKISFLDFTSSFVRAVVFGFTIGIVGCYEGYQASKGTEGVGKAANTAVVLSLFFLFIEEIIIVQVFNWIHLIS